MKWTPCNDCGTPCAYYAGSFYRCRQCGYESISGSELYTADEAAYVLAVIGEAHHADDTVSSFGAGPDCVRPQAAREPVQLGLSLLPISHK